MPEDIRVDTFERLPEWRAFAKACLARRPQDGTWCEAWTVRDIVVHQTGTATELARVLAGHLEGNPVPTRGFEEREAEFHRLDDAALWQALSGALSHLNDVAASAEALPVDTDVAWTGRTMKAPWFAEHMRGELVLHGWDVTGDTEAARAQLEQEWMTTHSVVAVGEPLLRRGVKALGLDTQVVNGRLRAGDTADVVVHADRERTTIQLAAREGVATIETDPATRVLLLWGRRPADPGRIRSKAGFDALRAVRTLLSGY